MKPKLSKTSVIPSEIEKFSEWSNDWWDLNGPLKTLHDINETRLKFIQLHGNLADQSVLDVGCGGGVLAEAMAKKGAIVTGLDAATSAIKVAKAHAQASSLKIHYVVSALEDYETTPFQYITCMEMLEHVENPEQIIQECANRLAPHGVLYLSTLNRTLKAYFSAIVAAEYILGILPRQTHDYERFIKPSELSRMVRNAGLRVFDLKGLSYNPWTRKAVLYDSVSVNFLMACCKD